MWSSTKIHLFLFVVISGCALNRSEYIDDTDEVKCISERVIKRFQLNPELYQSCESVQALSPVLRSRRRIQQIFKGKPKPRSEVLAAKFHLNVNYDQTMSLVTLVNKIAGEYLNKCPPVIYYDSYVEKSDSLLLETLFKTFPLTYFHGEINSRYVARNKGFKSRIDSNCKSYILFLSDPSMTRSIIGAQLESRVMVVSRSTQWKLKDFLSSEKSSDIVNLLVIGTSLSGDPNVERPYVLYTHNLYTDGLGSNTPVVLTSWIKGALTRPHVNLFPRKFEKGFAGHRFQAMASNQPPFMFRKKTLDISGGSQVHWDGIEYRLLIMIGQKLNFSVDVIDTSDEVGVKSIVDRLDLSLSQRKADVGMSGVYIAGERSTGVKMSVGHSKDCAAFITLASKALPKYRAIMGPFQWPVWVALICIYLGGVFPIAFTDRLTLSHLIGNWGEIENMFWYVFGMFTNSLTFSGRYSWGNSQKVSTRILIGSYWLFTIIITACYTGSIIAFVTLPAFPATVDSVFDLLGLFFRVGTLADGGWESWFQNSSHEATSRLFQKMEYVSTLEEGIGNVTQSFFWNYAFLGSRAQLEYLVQSNFSQENISKRSALHLSEECFALFYIGYMFPDNSVYMQKVNTLILLAQQAGLITKIENEVKWSMQRSSTGRLLQASSSSPLRETIQEERQLTTADTEGMFLLMGIGYTIGAIALISEIVGGITNKCRQILKRSRKSFSSNWSSKRPSNVSVIEDEYEEAAAHAARKVARKNAAMKDNDQEQSFGWKQFNLTRKTLKEIYGDYNKPQPEIVLRGGRIHVEEHMDSEISGDSMDTDDYIIREKSETNAKDQVIENVVDGLMNEEIENALKTFDHTLATCNEEDGEKDEDDSDNDANVIVKNNYNINEEDMFGSYVNNQSMNEENPKILDNLQLFKEQQEQCETVTHTKDGV